jgi:hypothetical protein
MLFCNCFPTLLYKMPLGRIKQYKRGKVAWNTWASHLCCHFFLYGQNIHTIKWNTEAVLVTDKKDGLEVSDVKTEYTVMCCEQNAEGNHNRKMGNLWRVAKFMTCTSCQMLLTAFLSWQLRWVGMCGMFGERREMQMDAKWENLK